MTQDRPSAPAQDDDSALDASFDAALEAELAAELDDAPAAPVAAASPEAQPTDSPATPAPADADLEAVSPAAPGVPAPLADTPTPHPEPTTELEALPFGFTADGKRVDVPGAVRRGDRIEIPATAWDSHVQKNLANREAWVAEKAALQRDAREAREQKSVRETQAEVALKQLAEIVAEPNEEKSFEAWERFRRDHPRFVQQAEVEHYKRLADRGTERQQVEQQQRVVGRVEEIVRGGLDSYVTHYLAQPKYAVLNVAETRAKITTLLTQMAGQIFRATNEFVPDEQDPSLKLPRIDVDFAAIERVLDLEAHDVSAYRASLKKIEAAAKANAKAQAPRPAAPPALSAKGSPTGAVKQDTAPKNKAEFDRSMDEFERELLREL